MDTVDYAEVIIENEQAREIRAVTSKVPHGTGVLFCLCGEEIPHARRLLGYSVCVDCARASELSKRCYG